MKLRVRSFSWRFALVMAIASILAAFTGIKALESVRGPLAPAWVEQVTQPTSDLVALQFDLDMALNRREALPEHPCWSCRAREALTRNALSAPALRVMAMYSDGAGRTNEAQELIDLASRLSRRESIVQFWKIQQANRSGDVRAAVRHYDQALGVRPQIGEVLYPQIVARLEEPEFRAALGVVMKDGRHWVDEFILAAMAQGTNLPALAATFEEASPKAPINETTAPYERGLIALLASQHDYATAYRLARRLLPADAVLEDTSFNELTLNSEYSPLLWSLSEQPELASGLSGDDTLRVDALSGARGLAVYRVFVLDSGEYRFETNVAPVEGATLPASAWEAHCLSGADGLLGRTAVIAKPTRVRLDFAVPPACRAVRLSYHVANATGQDQAAIALTEARLRKRGT